MAADTDLQIYRGETRTYRFIRQVPGSVSGYTPVFTVKTDYDDAMPLFQVAGTIVDAVNGVIDVTLSPTESTQTPGDYVWDLWTTTPGAERVLRTGRLVVSPEVRI